MLLVAKEFTKSLKDGTQDVEELANYLMKNNSAWELAYSLADLMVQVESSAPRKIVVTQEEMKVDLEWRDTLDKAYDIIAEFADKYGIER